AGINAARAALEKEPLVFSRRTMIGAMAHYVANGGVSDFVPMNANFGIVEPLPARVKGGKTAKNEALAKRALEEIESMLEESI
ncbi:MAG: methylenetetrahydrofolate--tRNA-(uracil(54)-C(5))-methyltransferase (FADH(2)-oxidizing) TrmFO, partial [Clostridia bacterium]|nr:methylenetetrahydrofolate--tRNA-(uracil(54)-C(5))-methyltransferase (FADH(2)-oxidizing) TrmFO [Clostridia bacterium]